MFELPKRVVLLFRSRQIATTLSGTAFFVHGRLTTRILISMKGLIDKHAEYYLNLILALGMSICPG